MGLRGGRASAEGQGRADLIALDGRIMRGCGLEECMGGAKERWGPDSTVGVAERERGVGRA